MTLPISSIWCSVTSTRIVSVFAVETGAAQAVEKSVVAAVAKINVFKNCIRYSLKKIGWPKDQPKILRNISDELSGEPFGFQHILRHVSAQSLSNAGALKLLEYVTGCSADDEFEITTF